ncbi:MAG: UbiA-like polyprenyltransferase [Planctomycetota bacterium]
MATNSPSISLLTTARIVAQDIKLAHSVFALPFAVLAAFMAAAPAGGTPDWTRFAGQLALVVLAMVFARTVAMLANRLFDRRIDARNPRTAGRALPSGRLSVRRAVMVLAGAASCFLAVCLAFLLLYRNPWPIALGIPVLGWISGYPLLKRYTAACHLYLGSWPALSPIAAAIAVDPQSVTSQPALWLLAAMVLGWVAGFDVIYALQDEHVDRTQGLHSVPGRIGARGALWVSRLLHGAAAAALAVAAITDPRFGTIFGAATIGVFVLLLWEHATVARWGTTRLALAFFTLNGVISCVLGIAGVVDVLVSL